MNSVNKLPIYEYLNACSDAHLRIYDANMPANQRQMDANIQINEYSNRPLIKSVFKCSYHIVIHSLNNIQSNQTWRLCLAPTSQLHRVQGTCCLELDLVDYFALLIRWIFKFNENNHFGHNLQFKLSL